ncbi:hypothetical protein V6N12_062702 [Hibiscus sabdariffa]|uniref:Uncharacterized protein n=1 Tax=Hibiscus sabdariffa TaxID=183260 RepID=A0ABR2F9L6_9ROSI
MLLDKVKSIDDVPSRSRVIPVLHGLHEDGNTLVHLHVIELVDQQASEGSINGLDPSSLRDEVQQQDEITSAPNISATHEHSLTGDSSVSVSGQQEISDQVENSCAMGGVDQGGAMSSRHPVPAHIEDSTARAWLGFA